MTWLETSKRFAAGFAALVILGILALSFRGAIGFIGKLWPLMAVGILFLLIVFVVGSVLRGNEGGDKE